MPYLSCPRCRIIVHLSLPPKTPGRCPRCSTPLEEDSVDRPTSLPNATERGGGRIGREVERRIKHVGGRDAVGELANVVQGAAARATALAKGPLHAIRGTSEPEKMLKNAKSEFWNEFEEIANYNAIETLAEAVGDKDTAKVARAIRREEERMAKFLERQIPTLTKAVAQEEIPASQRRTSGGRRRRTT